MEICPPGAAWSSGRWCSPFLVFLESRAACLWSRRPCRQLWLLSLCKASAMMVGYVRGNKTRGAGAQSANLSRDSLHTPELCATGAGGSPDGAPHFQLQPCKRSVQVETSRWPAFRRLQFRAICRPLPQPLPHSNLCQPGSSHILPPGLSGKQWY